ncbi:SH2 domain-containing protein 3C-like isoform X2 [Myxocyprinus asiaticus]|nr:SH2 domain-containing protein 3C-like isoform X2 [Myxocyprinus asiaticus]XP_051541852.1 SH2 domain-containing protein 3C-like isoform X2 [Myxocyprinus asiaticus]XP_051541860.1 SH2 domain-containing protein 3C-like isoform X2 [Myxocyprinus asiaticus]XP_051541868.1 SH2 domain-containing protein 3C-like isoform X2 [Myxocyprinus asiaticus]
MENSGVYVKFSRETCLLNSLTEKLKKELEIELNLSSSYLSSHGWYHGRIPWEVSESLVQQNGDFLVRDSLTSIGDYALTCCWNQKTLHFLISKVLLKSYDAYTQVQYILEGETFDSVPALVHSYVGYQRPLTKQSDAHVYSPVNRTLPLRYLEVMFGLPSVENSTVNSPTQQIGSHKRRESITVTEALEIKLICPQRDVVRSFDGTLVQHLVVSTSPTLTRQRRSPSENRKFVIVPSSPVLPKSSEIRLCSSPTENTLIYLEPTVHLLSTMTHSNQNYAQNDPAISQPASVAVNHLFDQILEIHTLDRREEYDDDYLVPFTIDTVSCFRPSVYQSPLLPSENKPLETRILKRVKDILFEVDINTMAMHITKTDCMVARILDMPEEMMKGMGVSSGMELLTLPHGHQLRQDLFERFHTMSIMLVVQLLGCTGSADERAALLHKVISLASELKSNLGNMFGFAMVMKCLEFPQIACLEETWTVLRQKYTESAVLYEKTLKPSMKMMNDGEEINVPTETTFPHVLPLLSLLEKGVVTLEESESWESADTGVAMVLSHLDSARTIASNGRIFSASAEAQLQGFLEEPDVREVFLTEFQMRLLWGSGGVDRNKDERYAKFDEVLTALSNRLKHSHSTK